MVSEVWYCFRSYKVHEVLALLEDTDGITSANVYISPPENHDVSDEDSGEEDGGTVNNLSGNQLNAVSIATVVVGTERKGWEEQTAWIRTYPPTESPFVPRSGGGLFLHTCLMSRCKMHGCCTANHLLLRVSQ
jgi:hypothetical protein